MSGLAGKTCLVTGASGFLGGWVVDKLIEAGARPRCLVRRSSSRAFLGHPDLDFIHGDVTDPDSLGRAVDDVQVVLHVAGLIKSPHPEDYFRVNYLGTINLLEALRKRAPDVQRVVVVSSQTAAGPSEPGHPVDETGTPRPFSPYGRSKFLEEQAALAFADRFPVTIVRPPSVYGPRDRETLLVFQLIARGLRPVFPFGGAISTVHVSDLADGILLAAVHPAAVGRTYFVAGDEAPTPTELMVSISRAVGGVSVPLPLPKVAIRAAGSVSDWTRRITGLSLIFDRWKAEELATGYWACSNERAKQDLGFRPRVLLADGLAETAAWYREHGWL